MSFANLNLKELSQDKFKHITQHTFMELEVTNIYANPNQPRKEFDSEYIKELSQSIVENGLIQPIAVVKTDMGYMIISGECRYKATLLAELSTIKAHIIHADAKKIDELSLIENIQRKDLTQFEIAKFIYVLWQSGNYEKKKDLAKVIGKRDTYVSKALSIFNLPENIVKDIENNKRDISISVLDEIARAGDSEVQKEAYTKYKAGDIKRDDIKKLKSVTKREETHNLLEKAFGLKKNNTEKRIYTSYHTCISDYDKDSTIFNCNEGIQISVDGVNFTKQKYKITIEEI